ncbi:EAL domain-containing protein [Vibrio sp. V27_P1S3P104]|nr:EAL domain-containing protein [Vibrio sp. V28_P6S34P95]NAX06402.1 EAL domain-containing protein [Vibrio sp. V30_P3S12P165]NAX36199.1 EAL domain-containing protein [Vibrio sp. V27_P1S3P104]
MPSHRTKQCALSLLLLPLLIYFAAFPLISSSITTLLLNQKKNQIELYLIHRGEALQEMIKQQLTALHFDCNNEDWQIIRNPHFYNRYIRFMSVETKEGKQCSTLGYPLILDDIKGFSIPVQTGFSISATPVIDHTESELLIQFTDNNNRVIWVIDSSWIQNKLDSPCNACFYYQATFLENGTEVLSIKRGNEQVPLESNAKSVVFHGTGKTSATKQQLWSGEALQQYIQYKMIIWGAPISLLLGLLLMSGYWLVRNYRNSIEGLIEKGIRDREFIPYYQPIVDSRTQKVVGYEVLLRWQKGHELVAPDLFIYAAESTGLIVEITTQIIRKVLNDLERLPSSHWVSINLVAEHVEKRQLSILLHSLNWPQTQRIKFELTERIPIKNLTVAAEEIALLMEKGYQFKIDDFGTGYGGFSYLQHLHIRSIKIDKMFVDTIETDDVKKSVLNSIIASAKTGKIELIAEGAETLNQVNYLAAQGVYLIQGYVYAHPMPINEIVQRLNHTNSSSSIFV